jgi:hypothetical protein
MSINPRDAAQSLSDIERTQQRTREALYYGGASTILLMWGGLCVLGYVVQTAMPYLAERGWIAITVIGTAATLGIGYWRSRGRSQRRDPRMYQALLVLTVFGFLFTFVLWPVGARQISAFWPMLYMLGFVLAGLWAGRFFILCGLSVTLLIIIGYVWSGPWFPLWLAVANGGGLIAGGLWLRQTSR